MRHADDAAGLGHGEAAIFFFNGCIHNLSLFGRRRLEDDGAATPGHGRGEAPMFFLICTPISLLLGGFKMMVQRPTGHEGATAATGPPQVEVTRHLFPFC